MKRMYIKWALLGAFLDFVISVPLAVSIHRIGSIGMPVAAVIAEGIGSMLGVGIAGILVLRRR